MWDQHLADGLEIHPGRDSPRSAVATVANPSYTERLWVPTQVRLSLPTATTAQGGQDRFGHMAPQVVERVRLAVSTGAARMVTGPAQDGSTLTNALSSNRACGDRWKRLVRRRKAC